jgi:PTH1 family peptidyl-tRNA hydrolase
MESVSLIVGLGNPGGQYARTRHNAGFMVLDQLAARWRAGWSMEKKFEARLARLDRAEQKLYLCQPQTYMNASGEAVKAVAGFYRVPPSRMLVVVDDADLPLGTLRLRPDGSSGGHHGLESIEQHLGTRAYPRLRVGIGRHQPGVREITGHVLGAFNAAESKLLDRVLARACDQIECWLDEDILRAMNKFNGAINSDSEERP